MPRAKANGIEIEYDTFGSTDDPTLLLVMGLGAQLTTWDERFCRQLADRGFYVIRYDNRDVGLSTYFDDAGVPDVAALALSLFAEGSADQPPTDVPYTLDDMADDGIGLLDALGIPAAHLVGASMGGMIVQAMTIRHPRRVLSLCSIMSTTGDRSVGNPDVAAVGPLMQPAPTTREEAMDAGLAAQKIIGSPGFPLDEARVRERSGKAYDRAFHPEAMPRQMAAILASGDRTAALGDVTVPTLVIHGEADPLVTPSGGEATAKAVPGAELMMIPGMGHDLPEGAWPRVVSAIVENARRATAAV
ncbi:MAG TPA: alpha/beta hydrolase [Acidimicrobiales bacterium]|nr:alpha/beta hydrolase [Acidimicrobiales bacterium]